MVKAVLVLLCVIIFSSNISASEFQPAPEPDTGYEEKLTVYGAQFMVSTANPHATRAAYDILKEGGTAVDAMIAAQAMLGLVEPQSSGLGGGAFVLYYDANTEKLHSYDARERAPFNAIPNDFLDNEGKPLPFYDAVLSGKSVGVPGVPRLLQGMYDLYGASPWQSLFKPTIDLAREGFEVSPRLAKMVAEEVKNGRNTKDFDAYFKRKNGKYVHAGDVLKNPEYAQTLHRFAFGDDNIFYKWRIAREIAAKAQAHGGVLSSNDFSYYVVRKRQPVCAPYRSYIVCSMGEPSSGGLTILQALGMLERFPLPEWGIQDAKSWHVIAEASRLAFADRNEHIADPDYTKTPGNLLIEPGYLDERSFFISENSVKPEFYPGDPQIEEGTTHISIIDRYNNVLSMTSSIESAFGSRHMAAGYFLNNQLTDFAFNPLNEDEELVANRIAPGKRPRSSMAPTIVFKNDGSPYLVIGSAGGSRIIGYVLSRLIAVLDWDVQLQAALNMPNILARGPKVEMESTIVPDLVKEMEKVGHEVVTGPLNSGLTAIQVIDSGFLGAADPRREGKALGR